MAGPSVIDTLFQRSLDDTIKVLRLSPPATEPIFIAKSLDEIRREIKSTDPQTKAIALQKLTYLHSIHGADASWAAFHSVELSSSSAHSYKRIAFLSAALSFNPSTTEVILLLTHQLRKDLSSTNVHEVSLALSTLSSICNSDLARDLTPELFTLLGSNKFFVRKKAVAAVLRVFELYPDAVRVCFKRVVENLESVDLGVLSTVVGLFCEITAKEPKSYLPLAPEFYKILVDCRNNWVLIKVLKIFAKLASLEPRLGKRVVEPICEHLRRSGAKSLAFECVRTIVTSLNQYESALKLALEKVREFLLDDDPNLKYLGLEVLAIAAEKHNWAVSEHKELVVNALNDVDVNIKLVALRLVMSMISEDNVMEICGILIGHALKSDPEFCDEILGFILLTCSRNFYEVIVDFDWYVSFLGDMARIPHCRKGREIEMQLVDIGMRVKDARLELVLVARDLVIDPALLGNPCIHGVLAAAAWISGEYAELSKNPFETMEALLQPRTSLLAPSVRAVYLHSAFKVLTFCIYSYLKLREDDDSYTSARTESSKGDYKENLDAIASEPLSYIESDNENLVITRRHSLSTYKTAHLQTYESIMGLINLVEINLGPLAGIHEVEVQERACNILGLIKFIKPQLLGPVDNQSEGDKENKQLKASEVMRLIFDAFVEKLGPVSVIAQDSVPLPDGLVLKENLSDLEAICGDINLPSFASFSLVKLRMLETVGLDVLDSLIGKESEQSSQSTSLLSEHRKRHGLYYLPAENKEINKYPNAHDPQDNAVDEAEDLARVTEKSLFKGKPNRGKARPVVVKLDDCEGLNVSDHKHEIKTDLISGAVQEVLLADEATTSESRTKSLHKSSKQKEKSELNGVGDSKDNKIADMSELGSVGSGKSKHHTRGKERRHRTSGNENEDGHIDKGRSHRRLGKKKSRQRADGTLQAQLPVIPDFLL